MSEVNLALVGADGLAGEAVLSLLEKRQFPVDRLYLLSDRESEGKQIGFAGKSMKIMLVETFDFTSVDIAIFTDYPGLARDYATEAASAGAWVIETSGYARNAVTARLVAADINPEQLDGLERGALIVTPSSTSVMVYSILKPLHEQLGLERIDITTLHPVSHSGRAGVDELARQTALLLNGKTLNTGIFGGQIAFNLISQVGEMLDGGYTTEEMELVSSGRQLLATDKLAISATALQGAHFYGDCVVLNVRVKDKIESVTIRNILKNIPDINVMDEQGETSSLSPVNGLAEDESLHVGRIRQDLSDPFTIHFYAVADNVRRGVALNSVRIAEILVKNHL